MLHFKRVVIVGVGLLGGSIGLALRRRGLAETVVGVGRNPDSLHAALERGAIDCSESECEAACEGADVAVVCTPVQTVASYVERCETVMGQTGWITDVGSTKLRICDAVGSTASGRFCGSHPLAGSDRSGVWFADADLFSGRLTVLTPTEATAVEVAEATERFWRLLGSQTLRMPPAEHDQAVARTSHLPHIVAAALAGGTDQRLLPLAASGWCDTTRIAAGSPELWRQILEENRPAVLASLREFSSGLEAWIAALESGDFQRVTELLERGKQQRDSVGN